MPSIFSRSRTQSTPFKPSENGHGPLDEFGRVPSRSSTRGVGPPSTPVKKDKNRDKNKEKLKLRPTGASSSPYEAPQDLLSPLPEGSFLPLNLDRPRDDTGAEHPKEQDYGYLSYERHVVLGLDQLQRLVEVVCDELTTRGLTTPFIFSSLALDLSSSAIKRLIHAFLRTCNPHGRPSPDAERHWREEARFAGPHELGICLRWGLARVVRYVGGQDARGLISWESYNNFRETEASLRYPPAHFATLLTDLPPALGHVILTVMTLLTRLTAHSASSGHTPPTLSPLFGPLIFGLGPPTLAFHHTYVHYLRATNAMEHLTLAFIRWQDAPRQCVVDTSSLKQGSAAALGVPTRLKEWIRGYPQSLPFLHQNTKNNEKPQARKGARTLRVLSVRRNVRMYSPDLVKTAATWAQRPKMGVTPGDRGLMGSKEWDRIAPPTLKLPPRYSDAFKKRMDLPSHFHPETVPGTTSIISVPSTSSSASTASTVLADEKDYFGTRPGEDRFRSLTDLKWGEFESIGFGGIGANEKLLQFDLTEGARNARANKRTTLTWNDFSSSGFSRSDEPLNATLQFSTPLANTISSWPSHNVEISKKLKKTQRSLPAFGWDTEPVMGSEEMIEEAFLDVFCDLIYGGGWMDLERVEEVDRDCNWALVEFKSMPVNRMTTTTAGTDPRTGSTIILFEEFVPFEYRQQLASGSSGRHRLRSLFTASKKQWKPAATLNGRPYAIGQVPHPASFRELEFEGLLRGSTPTKVISLTTQQRRLQTVSRVVSGIPEGGGSPRQSEETVFTTPVKKVKSNEPPAQGTEQATAAAATGTTTTTTVTSPANKRLSRFRLPGGIPVPSPGGGRKAGLMPSEYSTVDFETRLASYSDDDLTGDGSKGRRESKDDAWVDILVGGQTRRMGSQEAEFRKGGVWDVKGGISDPELPISDPELASQEVAQALAAVKDLAPSSDGDEEDMEPIRDEDTVDEIVTAPRNYDREYDHGYDHGYDQSYYDEHGTEEEEQEVEPEIETEVVPRQRRRLGYFDLHPERRPASRTGADDEDPRARLHADSDEEPDDEALYGPPDPEPAAPSKYGTESYSGSHHQYSLQEDDYGANTSPLGAGKTNTSKTAQLIEMYRKKERGGQSPGQFSSRLPVRTGALPEHSVQSSPGYLHDTLSPDPDDLLSASLLELKGAGRYEHGTPLHNVKEEEEEA